MTSILDSLRAQASQLAKNATVDLPVAGYTDPQLFVRYRWVDPDEARPIGDRVTTEYTDDRDRLFYAGMAVMAEACEGIYVLERGADKKVQLDVGDDGGLVTFEPRLDAAFGFTSDGHQSTIRQLFKGNDYAVFEHSSALQRWMADTTKTVVGSLGEQ